MGKQESRNKAEALFEEFLVILRKKNKLEVIGDGIGTKYSNKHYRLDMQQVTKFDIYIYIIIMFLTCCVFLSICSWSVGEGRRGLTLPVNLQVTAAGWNLQIQPNKESKVMALAMLMETVSTVIVPRGADGGVAWGAEEIIKQFRKGSKFKELRDGKTDLDRISKRSDRSSFLRMKKWGKRTMDKTLAKARNLKRSERGGGQGQGFESVGEWPTEHSLNASTCEDMGKEGSDKEDVGKGTEREPGGGQESTEQSLSASPHEKMGRNAVRGLGESEQQQRHQAARAKRLVRGWEEWQCSAQDVAERE